MENKEAIERLRKYWSNQELDPEDRVAIRKGMDALYMSPCKECVSKEQVIKELSVVGNRPTSTAIRTIEELQLVYPEEETAHWVPVYQGDTVINYRCSNCSIGNTFMIRSTTYFKYCPECGRKMINFNENDIKIPGHYTEKLGNWIIIEDLDKKFAHCDICGTKIDGNHLRSECPHCHTKMNIE